MKVKPMDITHRNHGSSMDLPVLRWELPSQSLGLARRVIRIVSHRPDIIASLIMGGLVLLATIATTIIQKSKHQQLESQIVRIEQQLINSHKH